jgi:DNA-binding response OmpR family regulator
VVTPSCPALLVLDDDEFRRTLIKTLDEQHFTVSFTADGPDAIKLIEGRTFRIIIVGLNLKAGTGLEALGYLRNNKRDRAVMIIGDASPETRTFAPWADETLMRPVDPAWVVTRARSYCGH